jgi:inosine-uridine nucleoside N-ribohydrolase
LLFRSRFSPPSRVIIDQDAFGPGGPNLQPILMVLQSPDVEVLGITVGSGDRMHRCALGCMAGAKATEH